MVFVKVRETYDLNTLPNKMSLIGIHTPKKDIIIQNFPGLLMQCKAYRPVSCDVRVACASMLPADPLQVATSEGSIAPEDLFNPILYKATSNIGMSQIEGRIFSLSVGGAEHADTINGTSASIDQDLVNDDTIDEFPIYYGLLSNMHGWRHASPQSGFSMTNLKPLVYEALYNYGDNTELTQSNNPGVNAAQLKPYVNNGAIATGIDANVYPQGFRGNPKPMPWLNCVAPSTTGVVAGFHPNTTGVAAIGNFYQNVPAPQVMVGCIIVPPSKLHQLYYRMVVEWTLEFSGIRPISEITGYYELVNLGNSTHYQSYDYSAASKVAGLEKSEMTEDTSMVSTNTDIKKVM